MLLQREGWMDPLRIKQNLRINTEDVIQKLKILTDLHPLHTHKATSTFILGKSKGGRPSIPGWVWISGSSDFVETSSLSFTTSCLVPDVLLTHWEGRYYVRSIKRTEGHCKDQAELAIFTSSSLREKSFSDLHCRFALQQGLNLRTTPVIWKITKN